MPEYLLENMTAKEAAEAVKNRKIVIVPVGAIHKHGDGPMGTDMFSCTELAKRIQSAVGGDKQDKMISEQKRTVKAIEKQTGEIVRAVGTSIAGGLAP